MQMNEQPDYAYKRKDGGTTLCYGKVEATSNFDIVCANEWRDGVYTDNDPERNTWRKVAQYLEKTYDNQIEQLEAI